MVQITQDEANALDTMLAPPATRINLGTIIRELQGTALPAMGTEAQIPICGIDGVPAPKTISGDATVNKDGVVTVGEDKIVAEKVKIVNRDVVIAIGTKVTTVTNAGDIDGVPLLAHFIAALDATATEIRSVEFVASTGALTITVNANATAATTVRVPILQSA